MLISSIIMITFLFLFIASICFIFCTLENKLQEKEDHEEINELKSLYVKKNGLTIVIFSFCGTTTTRLLRTARCLKM